MIRFLEVALRMHGRLFSLSLSIPLALGRCGLFAAITWEFAPEGFSDFVGHAEIQ